MHNIIYIYLTNTHSSIIFNKDKEIKEVKYNGNNKMGSFQGSNHY
jgi:hypothetical protein